MDTLTNKQYKSYEKLSRYNNFPYYFDTLSDKYVYGTTSYLKDDISYTIHYAAEGDTWDSLALNYYNNPTFFWIICDFNRVQDPFTEIKVGTAIKIPSFSELDFIS